MAEERTARLDDVAELAPGTRLLTFALDRPLAFAPGQFVSCLLPAGDARLTRAYTIASSPETPDRLELLVDRVPAGPGSGWLWERVPGDPLVFTGPWGGFTLERAPDVEAVFVAIGSGIAPMRPMLRRAAVDARAPLRLLHATTHPLWHDELAALPGVTLDVLAPDAVQEVVAARFVAADADRARRFWLCGVGPVVHRLRDLLRGAGYERRAVQYEKW